jgi:hypothetical protein
MKKLILISAFLMGIAGLANATPVMCSVLMGANTTANTGSTCTVTPDAGFFISALTLTATDDYTGVQSGTPTVSFSATLSQSTSIFGATYCNVLTGGTGSIPCVVTILPASTVSGLNLPTYSVHLTNASNFVTGGAVTGASIVLELNWGETLIPVTGTPEPATLGLMSGGLLFLGLLARRKKAKQAQG